MKLTYTDAIVIHSEKYNSNNGIYAAHLYATSTMHDIVFKLIENDAEFPISLQGLNLILYKGQSVSLISVDAKLVAYIDKKSKKYYYLTKNFANYFGFTLKPNWQTFAVLIVPVISSVYFFEETNGMSMLIILSLFALYIAYLFIFNFIIEKKLDRLIKDK